MRAMTRLIIASNRTARPGEARPGGLAVALLDALNDRGGIWFGWSGEVLERETRGINLLVDGKVDFALANLTRREYEGYYLGYANRALWPVLHYRVDLAEFDDEAFSIYEDVNRRFGRLLAQLLRADDLVWIHDYHFFLLARELRYNNWRGPTGFFLHIPFPAPEVFAALPAHVQIARGLAEHDLVGFQTRRDTENFRRYMAEHHGAELQQDGWLRVFGRRLRAAAFPVGIDPDEIRRAATDASASAPAERLGRILEDRALVLGVDRMDYSKGLPQRLAAFGALLDNYDQLRGRVSYVQISPLSREEVNAYADLREEVDRLAGRINSEHADLTWTPIRYLVRGYPRETLAGLYRLARVGLVTPLRDGMNLVAKEFVAAQDPEDPGVLVLSEFAGAAEQLDAALLVNPHDVNAVAAAIWRALEMSADERIERWQALDSVIRDADVARWRNSFLDALTAAAAETRT
ncbi:MAG: alpha,alpha-trehalose-phosphate synthase (UDP-forming) [Paracoccaceae bacterium]|nr:MAG: alpha,alpha-trehalose-phosphate synthase (UDP-forming) [Paracoccaceae bacterium]